jgi:hypothetical protein
VVIFAVILTSERENITTVYCHFLNIHEFVALYESVLVSSNITATFWHIFNINTTLHLEKKLNLLYMI